MTLSANWPLLLRFYEAEDFILDQHPSKGDFEEAYNLGVDEARVQILSDFFDDEGNQTKPLSQRDFLTTVESSLRDLFQKLCNEGFNPNNPLHQALSVPGHPLKKGQEAFIEGMKSYVSTASRFLSLEV